MRVALCQLAVTADKQHNLQHAAALIRTAVHQHKAQVVALPECFNSPYSTDSFAQYAETISSTAPGSTYTFLSNTAKEHGIHLIGGSIPEIEESNGHIYNTATVFNPEGKMIAKHRKLHLFDIDIPNKIRFMESDVLSAGNNITTFMIGEVKVGLGICYDMRFPELASIMTKAGCSVLFYPGAFNTTTGPMHWELLQRARAVDNQVYVLTVSPARNESGYQAWGHSSIIDPMGRVVETCEETETVICADLDLELVRQTREQIPVWRQRRHDLYQLSAL